MLICSHSCFRLCVYVMRSTWLRIFLSTKPYWQQSTVTQCVRRDGSLYHIPPNLRQTDTGFFYKSTRYTTGSCSVLVRNIYKHCHRPTKECGQFLITPHTCSCPSNRWTLLLIMLTQFGEDRHSNKWQVCSPCFFGQNISNRTNAQGVKLNQKMYWSRKKSIMFVQYSSW